MTSPLRTYGFWRVLHWLDVSLAFVRFATYSGLVTGLVLQIVLTFTSPVIFRVTMPH